MIDEIVLDTKFQSIDKYVIDAFMSTESSFLVKDNMNRPAIAMESVKDAVLAKLYELNAKKIASLDKSYASLYECGGDITKHVKFNVLSSTMKTLEKIKIDNSIQDKWLDLILDSFNRLVLDAKIFVPAFKSDNELAKQYFFSTAMSLITLTTFVVTVMINIRNTVGGFAELTYEVNDKAWRGAPKFTKEMLSQYLKFSTSGKLEKDIKSANGMIASQEDFSIESTLGNTIAGVAGTIPYKYKGILLAGAITLFVFMAAGPIVRTIIYTVATIKQNLMDYFDNMENLLTLNISRLEDQGNADKIISKQKKYLTLIGKFKAVFIKDISGADRKGSKELRDEESSAVKNAESGTIDDDVIF